MSITSNRAARPAVEATDLPAHGSHRAARAGRHLRNILIIASGSIGLIAATAAPAFAMSGINHTEPLHLVPRRPC